MRPLFVPALVACAVGLICGGLMERYSSVQTTSVGKIAGAVTLLVFILVIAVRGKRADRSRRAPG